MPGPVPKRSDQRRHRRKPKNELVTAPGGDVVVPEPDPDWHDMARQWYESLGGSGQSVFYERSDWATAWVLAELLSRQLLRDNPSAVMVQAWQAGARELLTTEGARRRVQVELQREPSEGDAGVAVASELDEFRSRRAG